MIVGQCIKAAPRRKEMKKIFTVLIVILFLVCLAPVSGTFADGPEVLHHPPLQIEQPRQKTGITPFSLQIIDADRAKRFEIGNYGDLKIYSSGQTRFFITADGNLYQYDSSGTVETFNPSDRTIYINSYTQLSSWSGQQATAGQSYFQTEPGKIYWVDPYAINASIVAKAGNGASTFAGVSAILPDASTYSGPAYDVTVGVLTSGTTGYANQITGVTIVYVYPYPGSGTTWYGAQGKRAPQTLLTEYSTTTLELNAGASYWELNRLGENATFGLYDGGVSAFIMRKKVMN